VFSYAFLKITDLYSEKTKRSNPVFSQTEWDDQTTESLKEFVDRGNNTGLIALKLGTTEAVVYTKAYELGIEIPEEALLEEAG
jgi:hypothetical protein